MKNVSIKFQNICNYSLSNQQHIISSLFPSLSFLLLSLFVYISIYICTHIHRYNYVYDSCQLQPADGLLTRKELSLSSGKERNTFFYPSCGSNTTSFPSGVPQASVLSPTLLILFISDFFNLLPTRSTPLYIYTFTSTIPLLLAIVTVQSFPPSLILGIIYFYLFYLSFLRLHLENMFSSIMLAVKTISSRHSMHQIAQYAAQKLRII